MNAVSNLAKLHKVLSASALTDREKTFIRDVVEISPEILNQGRQRKKLTEKLAEVHGYNPVTSRQLILDLVDKQVMHFWSNTKSRRSVSFRRKEVKRGRCVYCRRNASGLNLTVDHVVPRSQGGDDFESNLVDCCAACNQSKSDRTPAEWALSILKFREPFRPVTRLPMQYRIKLGVSLFVALLVRLVVSR